MTRRGLLALAVLTPGTARSQAPEVLELAGQPVLALAAHPAIGPRLRAMSQGRQRLLSEALRGEGPPLARAGDWVHGRARAGEARLLLAFDTRTETVAIILYQGASPSLFVPPRIAPWPVALRAAVAEFSPEVAAGLRFAASGGR